MDTETLYHRLGITPTKLAKFCQTAQITEFALSGSILRDQLSGGIQQTVAPPGFARKGRSRLGAGRRSLVPLALTPQRTLP